MNSRDKKKEKLNKIASDYEDNLKLHYEAMANELNTIIRNSLPNQMINVRTLMWVNIVFLGISLKLSNYNWSFYLLLISVFASFLLSFYAMIFGRSILYGNSQRRGFMYKVKDGDWAKTTGIYNMMFVVQRAIRYNGMIIIKRSRLIKYNIFVTIFSLFALGICFITTSKEDLCQTSHNQQHLNQVMEEEQEALSLKNKAYIYLTPKECIEHIKSQNKLSK